MYRGMKFQVEHFEVESKHNSAPVTISSTGQRLTVNTITDHGGHPSGSQGYPKDQSWRDTVTGRLILASQTCSLSRYVAHCPTATIDLDVDLDFNPQSG